MKTPNIRTMTVGPEAGKDVMSTSQLTGNAKPDNNSKATNETVEYTNSGGKGNGPWGGEDSKS